MKDVKSRVHQTKSMNTLYCGLDVHKETTYATIINIFGEVQTQKRMRNEEVLNFLEPYQVEKVAMKVPLQTSCPSTESCPKRDTM